MKPIVSIIMGSTSDLPVMEKAAKLLDEMQVPFEINALSAHRTPEAVEEFAKGAAGRGIKVIIAAAGMAAALPGVIAASTTLPVIGVPIKGSVLDGVDALYSIIQMPPGIPVATVAINGAMNAAILAVQILALSDAELATKFANYKTGLKNKIVWGRRALRSCTDNRSYGPTVHSPFPSSDASSCPACRTNTTGHWSAMHRSCRRAVYGRRTTQSSAFPARGTNPPPLNR